MAICNNETTASYLPIYLHEMDSVSLMSRTDTKYVFSATLLPDILEQATNSYRMLEVDNQRVARYKTTYFDTPEFDLFHVHQNGKLNRNKIRVREYVQSGLTFLEIKKKTNKGVTQKGRIKISHFESNFDPKQIDFIESNIGSLDSLSPSTIVHCNRITLVSCLMRERVTLDFDLRFESPQGTVCSLPSIAIAEVKKSPEDGKSLMQKILLKNGVKSMSISKYCAGISLLYPQVKSNNYKEKLRTLDRIAQQK